MLNFVSLLQLLDGVSSESENERYPNRALDCKTRGEYAPGFGFIPPRLGLWARPLDGPDFSLLRVVPTIGNGALKIAR